MMAVMISLKNCSLCSGVVRNGSDGPDGRGLSFTLDSFMVVAGEPALRVGCGVGPVAPTAGGTRAPASEGGRLPVSGDGPGGSTKSARVLSGKASRAAG